MLVRIPGTALYRFRFTSGSITAVSLNAVSAGSVAKYELSPEASGTEMICDRNNRPGRERKGNRWNVPSSASYDSRASPSPCGRSGSNGAASRAAVASWKVARPRPSYRTRSRSARLATRADRTTPRLLVQRQCLGATMRKAYRVPPGSAYSRTGSSFTRRPEVTNRRWSENSWMRK